MKAIKVTPKPDHVKAEAELVEAIKVEVYKFSGTLTVAQAIGCLRIAENEICEESK